MNVAPLIRRIPGGALELTIERADIPLDDALAFAARRNPRRRFLFVSRLLGRHMPTRPHTLRAAAAALAQKLPQIPGPILFIGMAETATTLGQCVWREWLGNGGTDSIYVDTTRRPTGGEVAFAFSEAHSHVPGHLVHRPAQAVDPGGIFERAAALVIVDDEVTTGRTAAGLAAAYARYAGRVPAVHLLTLVYWKNAVPDSLPVAMHTHALIEGRFAFVADVSAAEPELPPLMDVPPAQARTGTRHGLASPQECPWVGQYAGRVLVVGSGEFGFLPLRFAEQLEVAGSQAFVQATTRSPVLPGGAIGHVRSFPALDGSGYTEFLYNVPDDHDYDHVVLCCEDALPPPGHPLLSIPRLEAICHEA